MIYLGSGDDSMKYYLIGIKGSGMSALASLLHDLGNTVVGYDDSLEEKFTMQGLNQRGIKVYHDDSFIPDKDYSSSHLCLLASELRPYLVLLFGSRISLIVSPIKLNANTAIKIKNPGVKSQGR